MYLPGRHLFEFRYWSRMALDSGKPTGTQKKIFAAGKDTGNEPSPFRQEFIGVTKCGC